MLISAAPRRSHPSGPAVPRRLGHQQSGPTTISGSSSHPNQQRPVPPVGSGPTVSSHPRSRGPGPSGSVPSQPQVPHCPPGDDNTTRHDTTSSQEDSLAQQRSALLATSINNMAPFLGRSLDSEEWLSFEHQVDRLTRSMGDLLPAQERGRPAHPTTHWRRRQHSQRNTQGRSDQSPHSHPSQNSTATSPPPPPTEPPRRHGQHRRNRYNAFEASRVQRWYRANRKKCVRSIQVSN